MSNTVFFIETGEVLVYESQSTKESTFKLTNRDSFGEIEYYKNYPQRKLLAKASTAVTCYTLSYEIFAKYCQNMIDKEVEDLRENAIGRHDEIIESIRKSAFDKKLLEHRQEAKGGDGSFRLEANELPIPKINAQSSDMLVDSSLSHLALPKSLKNAAVSNLSGDSRTVSKNSKKDVPGGKPNSEKQKS